MRCSSFCSICQAGLIKAQCRKVPYWDGRCLEAGLRGPKLPKAGVDILCSTQLLKDWDQVQQLGICHVIKPRLHGHLGQEKGSINLPNASSSLPCPRASGGWLDPPGMVCSSGKVRGSPYPLPLPPSRDSQPPAVWVCPEHSLHSLDGRYKKQASCPE